MQFLQKIAIVFCVFRGGRYNDAVDIQLLEQAQAADFLSGVLIDIANHCFNVVLIKHINHRTDNLLKKSIFNIRHHDAHQCIMGRHGNPLAVGPGLVAILTGHAQHGFAGFPIDISFTVEHT